MPEPQKEKTEGGKRGFRHIVWGIVMVLVFILLFGVIIQLLWNGLMPDIFGLKKITYLQGVGLLILSRLLFGGMGRRREHTGYLTGKYGFRSLLGRGLAKENPE